MVLIVQLGFEAAAALHGLRGSTPEADEVRQAAGELGFTLRPLHPGTDDTALVPYFSVTVDDAHASRVRDRLLLCRAVEAAYLKPPDAAP